MDCFCWCLSVGLAFTVCRISGPSDGGSGNPNAVCKGGVKECSDSNTVRSCAADLGEWEFSKCASGSSCFQGSCVESSCDTPGEKECHQAKAIRTCGENGAWSYTICPSDSCANGACQN